MSPQKKVSLFLILTVLFSALSYFPMLRAGTIGVQGGLFVFTLMWSPGLAALLTQLITTHSLRGMGWRLGRARWLGIAWILPVLYALPVYTFTWFTGLGIFPNPSRIARLAEEYSSTSTATTVAIFVLFSLTLDMVGPLLSALGEEIGWRGLFVPELAKTTNFTKTALISGVIWAAWHMPGIFLADLNDTGIPNVYAAAMFAILIIALSFPFGWLTLKSGSIWPAVLLHAFHNQLVQGILDKLTGKTAVTSYITGEFGVGMALTGLVVAYVFWRMQRSKSLKIQLADAQKVGQSESSGAI